MTIVPRSPLPSLNAFRTASRFLRGGLLAKSMIMLSTTAANPVPADIIATRRSWRTSSSEMNTLVVSGSYRNENARSNFNSTTGTMHAPATIRSNLMVRAALLDGGRLRCAYVSTRSSPRANTSPHSGQKPSGRLRRSYPQVRQRIGYSSSGNLDGSTAARVGPGSPRRAAVRDMDCHQEPRMPPV